MDVQMIKKNNEILFINVDLEIVYKLFKWLNKSAINDCEAKMVNRTIALELQKDECFTILR